MDKKPVSLDEILAPIQEMIERGDEMNEEMTNEEIGEYVEGVNELEEMVCKVQNHIDSTYDFCFIDELHGCGDDGGGEDLVNHPSHYTFGSVECIDAIEAMLTPEEFRGYLKGTVLKYLWRTDHKDDPFLNLSKGRFFLDKLMEKYKEMNEDEVDDGTDQD